MLRHLLIFALLGLLLAVPAGAELTDTSAAGFTCRTTHDIAAPPQRVWDAMTGEVGRWWNKDHTWSGDAANLFLDPVAGKEFGERLPGGGSVTHMDVIHAAPGRMLRLRGGLGPLQAMAVVGVLTVELVPSGTGTRLTATYVVGGYTAGGLAEIASAVDGVISEQFIRLGAHLGS